uniref:Uncharacterized protein n=2 Tax=unclassified Candidatus Kentrum TaxID=2643149 RepID=A0A451B4M4_9GAMM|nr:MAG: hypothetical protein BECKLPF1236B_GA0070989_10454 [Candidatus Kentron sp. LPFa]VFK67910.1 MAG: hypothetical protein BECKUNK1418G_GA0071005_11754 [Candidatus Kentron sp. UNK]VFK73197.1 MAG: hypothetical protein BECKUNK1418H_GA0071006_11734 [Candidatus Kentron sp. UNK]
MAMNSIEIRVGAQKQLANSVVLPQAFPLEQGDCRVARRVGEGRPVLDRREIAVTRLQSLFAHIPSEVSLVDELIAERRKEAAREARDK